MKKSDNAQFFFELATLLEAGVSVVEAVSKIKLPAKDALCWAGVVSRLQKGEGFSQSLGQSGLISRYELEILSVAEHAGKLPQGLHKIADSYEKRNRRISHLKSKLITPIGIVVFAILISAILTIVQHPEIALKMVIFRAMLWLGLLWVSIRMLTRSLNNDACTWLILAKNLVHTQWYKMQFQQVVFGALSWQIQSGIDVENGLRRVTQMINDKKSVMKLRKMTQYCAAGESLYNSIEKSQLPITQDFKQIILTAESSGSLTSSIEQYLDGQYVLLEQKINEVFEWVPRFYYTLAVIIAISVIL